MFSSNFLWSQLCPIVLVSVWRWEENLVNLNQDGHYGNPCACSSRVMAFSCSTSPFRSLPNKQYTEKHLKKLREVVAKPQTCRRTSCSTYFSFKCIALNWFGFLPAVSYQGAYLQQHHESKLTFLSEMPELEFNKEKIFENFKIFVISPSSQESTLTE